MPKTGAAQGNNCRAGPEPLLHGAQRVHKEVLSLEACEFYHVVDLPDGTTTTGQWDLRRTADVYLGSVDLPGSACSKSVRPAGSCHFIWNGRARV